MTGAGLMFEPEYTEKELAEIIRQQIETFANACDRSRSDKTSWCKCGQCGVTPTEVESVCCMEIAAVKTVL
jgi:hypothetical protein